MPKKVVKRADRSPLNDRRWLCELECGHEVWITAALRPKRAHCSVCIEPPAAADCEDCRRAARVRAAALEFPRGGYNPTEQCSFPEHHRSRPRCNRRVKRSQLLCDDEPGHGGGQCWSTLLRTQP